MKMELTQKDKRLLIFLAIFVTVVGLGYWGIYPSVKAIKSIDDEKVVQQQIKEANKAKIAMLPIITKDNEALEEEIAKTRAEFFEIMSSDEIDKLMTGMAISYSLHADSLDIQIPDKMSDRGPYQYSDKFVNPEAYEEEEEEPLISIQTQASAVDEYAEEIAEHEADEEFEEEEEKVLTGIYDVHLVMRLTGEESRLQRFIDDVSDYGNKLQVSAYRWVETSNVNVNDEGQYVVNTGKALVIELDMYMCEE